MKIRICTLSALALATALSFAQDKPAAPHQGAGGAGKHPQLSPEERFKKLDTNNDGSISLDEFKAGPMGKHEDIFKKMDTNSDGKVTLEEFKAFHPQHAPGGAGAPGKGAPHKGAPHTPPAAPATPAAPAAE